MAFHCYVEAFLLAKRPRLSSNFCWKDWIPTWRFWYDPILRFWSRVATGTAFCLISLDMLYTLSWRRSIRPHYATTLIVVVEVLSIFFCLLRRSDKGAARSDSWSHASGKSRVQRALQEAPDHARPDLTRLAVCVRYRHEVYCTIRIALKTHIRYFTCIKSLRYFTTISDIHYSTLYATLPLS
jgi:hypothetical protein